MSQDLTTLTEEEFNRRYGVRAIHLRLTKYDPGIGVEELRAREAEERFMKRYGSRFIWTLVEVRNGELYLYSGFHPVKRMGLIASRHPRPLGVTISVRVDDVPRTEAALTT
jgi:hypothetical protein